MSKLTEKAIKQAFIDLLNEKPINRITVKDLTEKCGINRNTFYYHYHDIPSLVESIVTEQINAIIRKYPVVNSLDEGVRVAAKLMLENRKAALHIFRSSERIYFEQSLWRLADYVVRMCVKQLREEYDSLVREEDGEAVIRYYKCLIFGYVIDWMEHDMSEDILKEEKSLKALSKSAVDGLLFRER